MLYQSPNDNFLNIMFQAMGFAMAGAFAIAICRDLIDETVPDVVTEEQYRDLWDTTTPGRRVQLVTDAGWITGKGKLTRLGEKIAQSKWDELSPAAQVVLRRRLEKLYSKSVIEGVSPSDKQKLLPAVTPQPIIIPLRDAPEWVRTEWGRLHGRTKPEVRVHRTEVAEIHPPVFEYAVRDIVAHKGGQTMRRYVPSYDTLLAVTPAQRALHFGGAAKLGPDEAIAVMDYWGPRYQKIDLYIHPLAFEPPRLIAPDLTERQMKILATIRSYVSSYRKEVFRVHGVTPRELDELRRYGLIDMRGAITTMGRNIVGREEPWTTYVRD